MDQQDDGLRGVIDHIIDNYGNRLNSIINPMEHVRLRDDILALVAEEREKEGREIIDWVWKNVRVQDYEWDMDREEIGGMLESRYGAGGGKE